MEDVWLCRRDYATARARLDDYVRGLRCGLNENLAHYFRNLEVALRADSPFAGVPEVAHAIRNYVGDAVPPHIVGALVDRIWPQAVDLQLNFLTTCMWKACSSLVSRSVETRPSWFYVDDHDIFRLIQDIGHVAVRPTDALDNVAVLLTRVEHNAPATSTDAHPDGAALFRVSFTLIPEEGEVQLCARDFTQRKQLQEWFSPFAEAPKYALELTLNATKSAQQK